jgi:hypothetical protein
MEDELDMLEVALRCAMLLGGWFLTIFSLELAPKPHGSFAAYA